MNNTLLRTARRHQGWSQQQLADFAEVSLSTIVRAERGEPIRIDNIQRICASLHKTPEQLGLLTIEQPKRNLHSVVSKGNVFTDTLLPSVAPHQDLISQQEKQMGRRLARLQSWVIDSFQDGTQLRWQLYYTSRNSLTDDGLLNQIARLEQLADDSGEHYQRVCLLLSQNYQLAVRDYPKTL